MLTYSIVCIPLFFRGHVVVFVPPLVTVEGTLFRTTFPPRTGFLRRPVEDQVLELTNYGGPIGPGFFGTVFRRNVYYF